MLRLIIISFFCLVSALANAQYQPQIDSLTAALQYADVNEQAEINFKLSKLYTNTNPYKAIELANKALETLGHTNKNAAIQQHIGGLYFRVGNTAKAIDSYKNALQSSTEIGNEDAKAQAQVALGGSYFITGNLSESLNNYLQALRFYELQQDKNNIVGVLSGLAAIYAKQNNFSKALEYNLKALNIFEASSNKFRTLMSYDQVGNLYLKQGNYAAAQDYYSRSLNLYNELNNKAGEASTLIQLANISFESGNYDQAAVQFQKSLNTSKQLKMLPLQAAGYNGLALVHEQQKLYDKAILAAKQAEQISKSSNLKIELELAYETLSRLYKTTSKLDKATTFENLSKEIKDSLYNDSTLAQLADLQLRYEGEKKQKQIELQQKEQEVLASELLRERQVKNAIGVFLILVLVGLSVFIYLYSQNKKIAQSLALQKKELEETALEITKQKEELTLLNNVKDRFFSIISHDLRNNLTTMKLYFDLVGNKDYTPSEDTEGLTTQISSSVENTIDLLENLLVWAQAQINKIEVKPQELNIHQLTESNFGLLGGTAHQKNITLINNCDCKSQVFADEDMINLVFRNLISNAIKFTNTGGKITVFCTQQENEACIFIEDTGVGVSKESIEKLFTKNLNPTTLGTANEKGTGLGLLLCKEFVEQNNGQISVSSVVNKGSTFKVVLPLKKA
ncbi:MAG: tetratricopeptide repeat-containing sensor histidine kinase [Bacteroidia bacterium]|nr:tetratricopeptide repeat-containing sensor histidine kinase [Bacteroidia bacterium]MBP9688109.1 tetratricopeptide repeat-containing sensor histidine kinase [Bacteroidia bacterium]